MVGPLLVKIHNIPYVAVVHYPISFIEYSMIKWQAEGSIPLEGTPSFALLVQW